MSKAIPANAYVLIIGAMKCGTTSLYDYLKSHPAICPAIDKEPEYFSENQDHGCQVSSYEHLWDFDATRHCYALEASTGYSKYSIETGVPQRMAAYGIQPRFIYLVRDPFQRIESQYDFTRVYYPEFAIDDPHHIEQSDYYLQLAQYQPYFARERFLILDFDELAKEPARTLDRVYAFLDLEAHYPRKFKPSNVTRRQSSTWRHRLKGRLRATFGSQQDVSHLHKERDRLVTAEKRYLTSDERQRIHARLQDNMARLHHEYGVDVAKWGFDV